MAELEHYSFGGGIAPYSDAVKAGNFYYLSGKIALKDGKLTTLVGTTVTEQAKVAIENMLDTIAKLGLKPSNIVKITAFLTDLAHFGPFNEVYKEILNAPYPARSCVMVKQLPMNALVEIEAILYSV